MATGKMTVASLASEAGVGVDEALLMLWEAGLEKYSDPADIILRGDRKVAAHALVVPTSRELRSPLYWQATLDLEEDDFAALLEELEIGHSPRSRRLPKGAVGKLRRFARIQKRQLTEPSRHAEDAADAVAPEVARTPWVIVGRTRIARLLTKDEVEGIHQELVNDFANTPDPIDPPGADDALLQSAVFRQHTSLGDEFKYPSVEMAAAALLHSLVHDHPFHNGNKRTALVAMIVLLDENRLMLTCSEDELFRFILRTAQHRIVAPGTDLPDREVLWLAEWIRQNSRNLEKGDRPIQWRRLKQILREFGCECEVAGSVGNRLNIHREATEPGLFGKRRRITLHAQVKYTDDGREALIDTVKEIRRRLRLDDDRGIDSAMFYGKASVTPGGFMVKYRKTLKRLAKL